QPLCELDAGHIFANQRLADKEPTAAVMNHRVAIDTADLAAAGVLPRARLRLIRSPTGNKVAHWRLLAERRMRADLVVFRAKRRQGRDKATQIPRDTPPPQPLAERAMKPLHFTLRLRMADAAVQQRDPLLQQ